MSMKPLADRLDGLVRNIGALGVAVLAVMVFYVVVSRYAVAKTPRWSEELPRLILVWVTFFGVVSAFIRGSHFRAGLTDLILPPGALRRAIQAPLGTCSAREVASTRSWWRASSATNQAQDPNRPASSAAETMFETSVMGITV